MSSKRLEVQTCVYLWQINGLSWYCSSEELKKPKWYICGSQSHGDSMKVTNRVIELSWSCHSSNVDGRNLAKAEIHFKQHVHNGIFWQYQVICRISEPSIMSFWWVGTCRHVIMFPSWESKVPTPQCHPLMNYSSRPVLRNLLSTKLSLLGRNLGEAISRGVVYWWHWEVSLLPSGKRSHSWLEYPHFYRNYIFPQSGAHFPGIRELLDDPGV